MEIATIFATDIQTNIKRQLDINGLVGRQTHKVSIICILVNTSAK